MNFEDKTDVTRLLINWSEGDQAAMEELWPLVYDELKKHAHRHLRRESQGHTLETSALVNEVYLRLVDQTRVNWQNRSHFFAIAATTMRHILINHANSKHAGKRGGRAVRIPLDDVLLYFQEQDIDILALDEALRRLKEFDPHLVSIVELRYFIGLTNGEIAAELHTSIATVNREWNMARTWLYRAMNKEV